MPWIRPDGTFYYGDNQGDIPATSPPSGPGMIAVVEGGIHTGWEPDPAAPPPPPDIDGFVAAFSIPGANPLYESVLIKVLACECGILRDHWDNFKAVIRGGSLPFIGPSIAHLKALLTQAEHPLSEDDINGWNALVNDYHLPPDCLLESDG